MSVNGLSALVVDDEKINILIFEKLLKSFGIEAVSASDGRECIACCEKKRFDYVFLDIRMPGMDGFETMRELQSRGIYVPVICITALTGRQEKKEILEAGFTDCMPKPINKELLLKLLNDYAPDGIEIKEEEEEVDDERLPDAFRNIPGIDAEYGIMHCGSVRDFLKALKIFSRSVDDRSADMDEYIKRGYIDDLEMSVHSLKSTALTVGAKQISEMAKLLEKACNEHNIPLVYSLTPEFLMKYRETGDELKKIFESGDAEEGLKDISENELMDAFSAINELIETYDRKNIDSILDYLKNRSLPPEWRNFFYKLREYLRIMDWESARSLIQTYEESGFK